MWAYERWSHWYRCQIKSFRDDEKRGPKKKNKQKKNVDADDNENEKSWPANRIEDFLSSGVEDDFFLLFFDFFFFYRWIRGDVVFFSWRDVGVNASS